MEVDIPFTDVVERLDQVADKVLPGSSKRNKKQSQFKKNQHKPLQTSP